MKSLFNFYENTMNQFLKTWGRVFFFKDLLSSAGENNNNNKKKPLITLFAELISYMYFFPLKVFVYLFFYLFSLFFEEQDNIGCLQSVNRKRLKGVC